MKNDLTNVKLCIVGCTLFLAGAVWTGLGVGLGVIALVLGDICRIRQLSI